MTKEQTTPTKKSSNKLLIIVVIVIAVLVGLSLLGKYIFKKVVEKATGISSNDSGQYTFKSDKGDVTFDSGTKLPENFPNDFPVYPGAKLAGSFSANGEGNSKGLSVVWESSDDSSKVGEYYKAGLATAGYKIVSDLSTDDSTTLSFEKDGTSGFLGVTRDNEGRTAISVTLGTD